ncbi:uncharacterized protein LOC130629028 isoform X1 [Hydractinia symbiolongicarpus]|uniref:uncharacterized protein LOC130629028 isoform X1 n=1 Tax=Hydractinia symbiolongicarpus TaxID=13093 RepID=UPI00254EDED2|nr:uncharacterized protein LOC130629028 isoform X1 [Hydractinia symbiolongicarpus]
MGYSIWFLWRAGCREHSSNIQQVDGYLLSNEDVFLKFIIMELDDSKYGYFGYFKIFWLPLSYNGAHKKKYSNITPIKISSPNNTLSKKIYLIFLVWVELEISCSISLQPHFQDESRLSFSAMCHRRLVVIALVLCAGDRGSILLTAIQHGRVNVTIAPG